MNKIKFILKYQIKFALQIGWNVGYLAGFLMGCLGFNPEYSEQKEQTELLKQFYRRVLKYIEKK